MGKAARISRRMQNKAVLDRLDELAEELMNMGIDEIVPTMVGLAFDAGYNAGHEGQEELPANEGAHSARRIIVGTAAEYIMSATRQDREGLAQMIIDNANAVYAVRDLAEFSTRYQPVETAEDASALLEGGIAVFYDTGEENEPQEEPPAEAAPEPEQETE